PPVCEIAVLDRLRPALRTAAGRGADDRRGVGGAATDRHLIRHRSCASARSRYRWILPVAVLGSSVTVTTLRGRLNDARPARQNAMMSASSTVAPGIVTT